METIPESGDDEKQVKFSPNLEHEKTLVLNKISEIGNLPPFTLFFVRNDFDGVSITVRSSTDSQAQFELGVPLSVSEVLYARRFKMRIYNMKGEILSDGTTLPPIVGTETGKRLKDFTKNELEEKLENAISFRVQNYELAAQLKNELERRKNLE